MKKSVLIVMVILLAFASGCGKHSESDKEPFSSVSNNTIGLEKTTAEPTSMNTVEATDAIIQQNDPPEQILFWNIEEYRAFADSVNLDDKAFFEFISSKSYDMNGVETKEDAKHVLEVLGSMPMPSMEGFVFKRSNLRIDADNFSVHFRARDNNEKYLGFSMGITESNENAADRAAELGREIIEIPIPEGSELSYLFRVIIDDASNPNSYYYTNIRSHRMCLITNIPEEQLLEVLQSCRYTTIDKYEE